MLTQPVKLAKSAPYPYLGFGLGLRVEHYTTILETSPAVDWFEIITENYLVPGGKPKFYLHQIRERYPMVMHGVSLSIGSTDPLNMDYLAQVKQLAREVEPAWISDHLCWTGAHHLNMHDLLPIPYTEEALNHVVNRVNQVQDFLQRRILLENVSSYITYVDSVMPEWEFLTEIAIRADCLILLDINNIHVSAFNHGFNPLDYLNAIPKNRVQQFHLAGHSYQGDYIIDTHDHPIIPAVWELLGHAVARFGQISSMVERDDNMPPLTDLLEELQHARQISANHLANTPLP